MSYLTLSFDETKPDQFDVPHSGCALDEALVRLEIAARSHAAERDRLLPIDRAERDAAQVVWDTTLVRLQQEIEQVRLRAALAARIANVAMRRALDGELS